MLNVRKYINKTLSSNTYLVWVDDEKDCLLVDSGDSVQLLEDLFEDGFNVIGILLTHSHFDHIYGMNKIIRRYPKVKVYTNWFGRDSLLSDKLNLSRYHFNPYTIIEEGAIEVLPDNCTSLHLLGESISVYHVPGHNPSCLAFRVGEYLFSGDAFIPDVKVITNIPKANKGLAERNYEYLKKLSTNCIVCAGHGDIIDNRYYS